MRIGELAKLSGLSVHSIRWYEAQHLIPGIRRNPSGHRDYLDWHVKWLALLHRLKLTGMSIAQMAAYARLVRSGESSLPEQLRLFTEHRARAAAEIAEKRRALAHIDQKITLLTHWLETGERPPIADGLMPKRPHQAQGQPAGGRSTPR